MTEKEFLPRREKFMKDLMQKKVPVKSVQSVFNWEEGKAWCIWETDTVKRLQEIMAEHPQHTEIIPVKLAPQIM
jgi:hypothetical protein